MQIVKLAVMTTTCLVGLIFSFTVVNNWKVLEGDYSIKFSTSGVSGTFQGLKGLIRFDESALNNAKFDVSVDVETIKTGIGWRDSHAKNENFFDVNRYPTIHFISSAVEKSSDGYLVTGDLKIKDVTNVVTIPFTFHQTGNQGVFEGRFEINRKDYNLERRLVGEIVKIDLRIPVTN